MTGPWDEAAERKRRGLPSKREQALNGLAPDQVYLYGAMVRDRRAAKAAHSKEREAMEARGTALVEAFAGAGFPVSYEWRSLPLVSMALEEAERLLQAFRDLGEAYDIAVAAATAAGRDLAEYAAALDSSAAPGESQER